jgi:hypothetical protein
VEGGGEEVSNRKLSSFFAVLALIRFLFGRFGELGAPGILDMDGTGVTRYLAVEESQSRDFTGAGSANPRRRACPGEVITATVY